MSFTLLISIVPTWATESVHDLFDQELREEDEDDGTSNHLINNM